MRVLVLRRARREDEGAVAVLVALLSTVLLLLAAFAVDIGNAYAQSRQLSVAVDSAALAAAGEVGAAIPTGQTCTNALLTSINATSIAKAAADAINTKNAEVGLTEPVDSVTVTCVENGNAVQVEARNSRGVDTALAGLIGIDSIQAGSYAVARYQKVRVAGGLRPWAVCDTTAQQSQNNPGITYVAGLDNKVGVCSSQSSGNWGGVDFDGGNNSAGDLASWTLNGYPGAVNIPSTLPADPGLSNSSALRDAFQALVGQVSLFPAVSGYNGGNGNNGSFGAVGIITVKVCGVRYGGVTYNTGSDCWVNPVQGTRTANTPTVQTATGGTIARNSDVLTIAANSAVKFTADMAGNPDVVISIPNAGPGGNQPLVTTIKTFTSPTSVVLDASANRAVTAPGRDVTITTTTYTTTPSQPAGLEFDQQGRPIDHIQFRFQSYTTSSYAGSNAPACNLADRLCVGTTLLWR